MINLGRTRRHAGKPGAVERAAKALAKRGRPRVTELEIGVLVALAHNVDPWTTHGDSRTVSQALARCRRKGLAVRTQDLDGYMVDYVTAAGGEVLFPMGVESFDVGDEPDWQCARCGSSVARIEGTLVDACVSSEDFCNGNPLKARGYVRGAGRHAAPSSSDPGAKP